MTDGNLISFVGSDDAARRSAPRQTEVDLRGRLLTPAFVDAHVHVIQTGQVMAGLGLRCKEQDDAVQRVAAYARHHPDAQVIIGHGWDERAWPEPLPPTRTELDRAAGGVAVYLARVDVTPQWSRPLFLIDFRVSRRRSDIARTGCSLARLTICAAAAWTDCSPTQRRSAARGAAGAAAQGVATVHELGGPHLGPMEDLTRVREVA